MKQTLLILACSLYFMSHAQDKHLSLPVSYDKHLGFAVGPSTLDSLKKPLNDFFNTIDGVDMYNENWMGDDYEKHLTPFMYLIDYYYLRGAGVIRPYVMSLTPDRVENGYLAKVALVKADSGFSIENIYYIFIAKNKEGQYKLKNPQDILTSGWERKTVGTVQYIIHPGRIFNEQEAHRMDSFNISIARYFHMAPINFKYYSCGYYPHLNLPTGEDNFFMTGNYDTMKGGYALNDLRSVKAVYSANNSEYYPHELVHIYVTQLMHDTKKTGNSRIVNEGIPTFLGGSMGMSAAEHLAVLAKHAKQHNVQSIGELFSIQGGMIGETEVTYIVGALIAQITDRKLGYKGIIELAGKTDEDLFVFLAETMDVPPQQLNEAFIKELSKYSR